MNEEDNKKNNKYKMILCTNMIFNNDCVYKKKCLYAHTIEEQKTTKIRQIIYNMIDNNNIDNIDLNYKNYDKMTELYDELFVLTKLCHACSRNNCKGGKNCNNGAYLSKYVLCYDDLYNNNCVNSWCNDYHISKLGVKSYADYMNYYDDFRYNDHNMANIFFSTNKRANSEPYSEVSETESCTEKNINFINGSDSE